MIPLNFQNIFMFLSSIIPFLLVFFMVMVSIFDYNVKGFVYIFGVFLSYGLTIPMVNTLRTKMIPWRGRNNNDNNNDNNNEQGKTEGGKTEGGNTQGGSDENQVNTNIEVFVNKFKHHTVHPMCYLFSTEDAHRGYISVPSFNSVIIAYTIAYLIGPMIINNAVNYLLIIFLFVLLLIDSFSRVTHNCTTPMGVVFGVILGLFIGGIYILMLKSSGYDYLLYNDDFVSNKVACSKPNKQQFKCAVYKNGQLISTNSTS